MYEYFYRCRCGNTDTTMQPTGEGQKALCPACAELHEKFSTLGTKAAKIQQAEDRLIGVIKGEAVK